MQTKRLEVMKAIKPICEAFNIKDYDYEIKETEQRYKEHLKSNGHLELDEIKIGSVIVTKEGNIYKILDFSLINEEYPIAILNVETDVIIQNSYSVDYMNLGGYIYIDKEEYILKVFN